MLLFTIFDLSSFAGFCVRSKSLSKHLTNLHVCACGVLCVRAFPGGCFEGRDLLRTLAKPGSIYSPHHTAFFRFPFFFLFLVSRNFSTRVLTFNLIVFPFFPARQKETQRKMLKIKAGEQNFSQLRPH